MPLQCGAHISRTTSTNWRWSNEMQLDMFFRTLAVKAAPLPWSRNFDGLARNSIDSWLGLPWCIESSMVSMTFHHIILQVSCHGHPMTLQQMRCRVKPYEASFFPASVIPWIDFQPQQWLLCLSLGLGLVLCSLAAVTHAPFHASMLRPASQAWGRRSAGS